MTKGAADATHAWLADFHDFHTSVDPEAMTVGEVWADTTDVVPYVANDELDLAFEFTLAEDPARMLDICVLWEGYADECTQVELFVWDDVARQWCNGRGQCGEERFAANFAGNRDGELSFHIREEFERYVDAEGRLCGVYTDGDLRRTLDASLDPHQTPVSRVMTKGGKRIQPDALAEEGLVVRRQGRGTFVAEHTPAEVLFRFFKIYSASDERVLPESRDTLVRAAKATRREAEELALRVGDEVWRIKRTRLAGGRPFVRETITLPRRRLRTASRSRRGSRPRCWSDRAPTTRRRTPPCSTTV